MYIGASGPDTFGCVKVATWFLKYDMKVSSIGIVFSKG